MPNFMLDAFNDFGKASASGECPNIINLGKASIERMTVDLKLPEGPITGTGVVLTIQGCDTPGGTYVDIVKGKTVTGDEILAGYGLPVPRSKYQYLKATIVGTFVGKIQAIINSYLGK